MKKDKPDQVIAEPSAALAPNTPAPDFTLQATPDQRVSLRDFRAGRQSSRFTLLISARCVAIRWRSTTNSCPNFSASVPKCSASRWTAFGITSPSRKLARWAFPCWPTLSSKGRSHAPRIHHTVNNRLQFPGQRHAGLVPGEHYVAGQRHAVHPVLDL